MTAEIIEVFERALFRDLYSFEGSDKRWAERAQKGLDNAGLQAAIAEEFGLGGGMCPYNCTDGSQWSSYHVGGANPRFEISEMDVEVERRFKISGTLLIDLTRKLLRISYPVPSGQLVMELR